MADYVVIVHPGIEAELRGLQARMRWRFAYRHWRNRGKPPMSLENIRKLEDEKLWWDNFEET